jgi:hypothetical protein
MDAFQILRRQAAEKRDSIIRAARAEFAEAKRRINALRRQLGAAAKDAPPVKFRRIADLIADVMPSDDTFTIGELSELLVKAEPGRRFTQSTIRTLCQRMEPLGAIRRVGRVNGKTLWASPSYAGVIDLDSVKRLPDVAADVLRACGSLRSADLLQRIRERGYRAGDNHRKVMKALRTALYRNPAFQRDKTGKWSLA